jgi:hypothetical protein
MVSVSQWRKDSLYWNCLKSWASSANSAVITRFNALTGKLDVRKATAKLPEAEELALFDDNFAADEREIEEVAD